MSEKLPIRKECEKFIKKDENISKKFNLCTKEDQAWALSYLATGKETIPNEMITTYNSLDISPEDRNVFLLHHFYSSIKDYIMTMEDSKNVKQIYQTMKLKNLGELNKIGNFQDTIILCKYLNNGLSILKSLLNIIKVNVILHVHLVAACIETKLNFQ